MIFLTPEQKTFIMTKNIKVGNLYSFPKSGFTAYETPEYGAGVYIETNPLTKSLSHELFKAKEITKNGFVKGNMSSHPRFIDFYIRKDELEQRSLLEMLLLLIILFIPFFTYNQCVQKKQS